MSEKFNLEKYFELYSEDDSSWILTQEGTLQVDKAIEYIKDYAHNRIREQANAYGYPHDVNLWVEDWSWEFGEDIEDLVVPPDLKHTKVAFSELVNKCDCPTILIDWTTYISENQMYEFGRWFRNRHEIPLIDLLYKPFGRYDKRMESVINSMEMGDYSRALSMEERNEIANERLIENDE